MFNFHKLVTPDYLFTVNRVLLTRSDKLFFVIGAIMVILAIALKIAVMYGSNTVDKILRNKLFAMFLTIGLLELVWFGARYENISFFGSHFVSLLILLVGLAWFVKLGVSAIKNYRTDKAAWEKEQVKMKYLPQ